MEAFTIGNATIYQGDCLQVLRTLQNNSIDAVITDPPYASAGANSLTKAGKCKDKYQNTGITKEYPEFLGENRDQRSFGYWSTLWATQCYQLCKESAPFLAFTDWRQLPGTTDYMQAAGFSYNGIVSWDKTESTRPIKGRFRNQCEFVTYGFKGKCNSKANPVYLAGSIRERVNPNEKYHMTGKPVPVMAHLVKVAPPGAVVLDPFMGSGSTGIAAIESGRRFIGIEATKDYYDIAKARLIEAHRAMQEAAA